MKICESRALCYRDMAFRFGLVRVSSAQSGNASDREGREGELTRCQCTYRDIRTLIQPSLHKKIRWLVGKFIGSQKFDGANDELITISRHEELDKSALQTLTTLPQIHQSRKSCEHHSMNQRSRSTKIGRASCRERVF